MKCSGHIYSQTEQPGTVSLCIFITVKSVKATTSGKVNELQTFVVAFCVFFFTILSLNLSGQWSTLFL